MIINGYATLSQFKSYGLPNADDENVADDTVIEGLINAASRYFDSRTGRAFYPRVETRYYSVVSDPQIYLDDDLLELTTLTNGDTNTISSDYYHLIPKNSYPKYAVRLKENSGYYWESNSDGEGDYVISVLGFWGFHEQYSTYAWKSITTLNEGAPLNATDTTFTVTDASDLDGAGGQIIKIENELMHVTSISTVDVTVRERGGNGSTAATHADGTAVYLWRYQDEVTETILQIVNSIYKRRTGENVTASSIITSGGVMVTPKDIPDYAAMSIRNFMRTV